MFNVYETRDEHKREEKTKERLDILRRAYKAGYFEEEGSESLPETVANGVNPFTDKHTPCGRQGYTRPMSVKPLDMSFRAQMMLYNAMCKTDRPEPCCTCGRNPLECEHACICWIKDEDDASDWLSQAETAFRTKCKLCAGFGTGYDGTECSACNGTGIKNE